MQRLEREEYVSSALRSRDLQCGWPLIKMMCYREEQRLRDEQRMRRRAAARAGAGDTLVTRLRRGLAVCGARLPRRYLLATAAVLLGVYAYYRPDFFVR